MSLRTLRRRNGCFKVGCTVSRTMSCGNRADHDSSKAVVSVTNECAGGCCSDLNAIQEDNEREVHNGDF